MLNETILFKDREGITREVTYLGPNLSAVVLKHRIRTQHGTKFLVDGVFLCSLDAPDISTVPVSVEQYVIKLSKLMHQQLEKKLILKRWTTINVNLWKFMTRWIISRFQYWLHLKKKEKLIESLSSSKIAHQNACHAFLVKPIVNLGVPRVLVVQFKKSLMMLQKNVVPWIH